MKYNKNKFGIVVIGLVVIMIAASLTGCVSNPIATEKTLIFACSGDADKLDPADVTDQESTARTDSIFEGLVEYKSGGTEIQACLAESWNVSTDGKTI